MNIYTRVYRGVSADPDGTAQDVAESLMRQATKAELLPLLVAEVRREQRKRVRTVEQRHGVVLMNHYRRQSAPVSKTIGQVPARDLVSRLRSFMDQPIRLFDGSTTTWGKATLDELRQRRAELVQQRAGISQTIGLLDDAIEVLEESGALCLADLPDPEELAV